MADIAHQFGQDIGFGASGDLQLVGGSPASVQSIIRRLLTNQFDYVWHTDYGTGIGAYIGQTLDDGALQGAIEAQMLNEASVSQDPAPVVVVTPGTNGSVFVAIDYADDVTGQPQSIQFTVSA